MTAELQGVVGEHDCTGWSSCEWPLLLAFASLSSRLALLLASHCWRRTEELVRNCGKVPVTSGIKAMRCDGGWGGNDDPRRRVQEEEST